MDVAGPLRIVEQNGKKVPVAVGGVYAPTVVVKLLKKAVVWPACWTKFRAENREWHSFPQRTSELRTQSHANLFTPGIHHRQTER